jgi:hypothetical protein
MSAHDTIPAPPPEPEPDTLPTGGCIECRQAPCACQFDVETYLTIQPSEHFEYVDCDLCDGELLCEEDRRHAGAHIEAYDRLGEGR